MTNKFMEANRKRFDLMKKPLLKKKAAIANKARIFVEKSKAEIAIIDEQIKAIQQAEIALSQNLTQAESPTVTEEPIVSAESTVEENNETQDVIENTVQATVTPEVIEVEAEEVLETESEDDNIPEWGKQPEDFFTV